MKTKIRGFNDLKQGNTMASTRSENCEVLASSTTVVHTPQDDMYIKQNTVLHGDTNVITKTEYRRINGIIVYNVLFIWTNKWDANDSCACIEGRFDDS